jgi:hypothetical protein
MKRATAVRHGFIEALRHLSGQPGAAGRDGRTPESLQQVRASTEAEPVPAGVSAASSATRAYAATIIRGTAQP